MNKNDRIEINLSDHEIANLLNFDSLCNNGFKPKEFLEFKGDCIVKSQRVTRKQDFAVFCFDNSIVFIQEVASQAIVDEADTKITDFDIAVFDCDEFYNNSF